MQTLINVCSLVLPVVLLISIGALCRKQQILNDAAVAGMKGLISNILLPITLFASLAGVQLSAEMALLVVISLVMNGVAFGLGFLFKKLFREQSKYFPYLLAGFEVGLMGLALFPLLYGQENLQYLATLDIGNCFFFFFIILPSMQASGGGEKKSLGNTLISVFKTPAIIGCIAGLLCSVTGLTKLITDSAFAPVYTASIDLATKAATPVVLVVVGYGLALNKRVLGKVLKTCLLRTLSMGLVCGLSLVLFRLCGIANPLANASSILMCSLSAPYICAVYAKEPEELEYVNTQLSLHVFVTVLVFTALSIFG